MLKRDAPGGSPARAFFVLFAALARTPGRDASMHLGTGGNVCLGDAMAVAAYTIEASLDVPPFEVAGPDTGPVVVALGGISAHRHVCAHLSDPAPGWWDGVAGQDRALDTATYRIVSFDYLDGGADSGGRPLNRVTTHDQADALARVLDHLQVARVRAIVGASYGAMVALAFADRYPDRVEHLIVIGGAHASHPMTTARRALQRRMVEFGLDAGRATEGLALARALGITTYRSAAEFAERFTAPPTLIGNGSAHFPVERYLDHHGERFATQWRPARFLALSLSGDLHAIDPARVRTPSTLIAFDDDAIAPLAQMQELAARLGAPAELHTVAAPSGHDTFLTDPDLINPIITSTLQRLHQ